MATQTFGVWISRPSQAIEGRDADTLVGFYTAAAEVLTVNPPREKAVREVSDEENCFLRDAPDERMMSSTDRRNR